MRMWMVNPRCLCRQHLLGEHVEIHKAVGSINKGRNLTGYLENGLLDISAMPQRHNVLVAEMLRRGMRHQSPLPEIDSSKNVNKLIGAVDLQRSIADLQKRCSKCFHVQG